MITNSNRAYFVRVLACGLQEERKQDMIRDNKIIVPSGGWLQKTESLRLSEEDHLFGIDRDIERSPQSRNVRTLSCFFVIDRLDRDPSQRLKLPCQQMV